MLNQVLEFLGQVNPKFRELMAVLKPEHGEELFRLDGSSYLVGYRWTDGPKGVRTLDLHNAIVALSQLSYGPLNSV